jgi:hypothetical protein
MTTTEVLMLLQTVIMLVTGVALIYYTVETRRLRTAATAQVNVMQQTLALQLQEEKRAAQRRHPPGPPAAGEPSSCYTFRSTFGLSRPPIRCAPESLILGHFPYEKWVPRFTTSHRIKSMISEF